MQDHHALTDVQSRPRVFVVGSNIAAGGTLMAYYVGYIIAKYWQYKPVNVIVEGHNDNHALWHYPMQFDQVKMSDLIDVANENDVLLANPSYSHFQFGLSFPGKKLMYVQGCNTFNVLDGFFDLYVAVSPFVQEQMKGIYDLEMPVIPPFVALENLPKKPLDWSDREGLTITTMLKWEGQSLLDHFVKLVKLKYPDLSFQLKVIDKGTTHQDVLDQMSKSQYFLWLSQIEGFGLPPLEAMACGCTVIGFHAGGGLSYFKHNENASVFTYPHFDGVIDSFYELLSDPVRSEKMAVNARVAAYDFSYNRFENNWLKVLMPFLSDV